MYSSCRIAVLNDLYRTAGILGGGPVPGRTVLTRGVAALPADQLTTVMRSVCRFTTFTPDNDPHREHDFGRVDIDGLGVFWKFDYFADAAMEVGSEDPADPARCYRLLTIMLTE